MKDDNKEVYFNWLKDLNILSLKLPNSHIIIFNYELK